MNKFFTVLIFILVVQHLFSQYEIPYNRQIRAVWVSTVKMLDYPSARGLSAEQLKAEYIALLDTLHSLNINTIIFQVRAAADAFFASPYEPWSEWLTGKQGRAPEPYFDPLQFFITEAHKRHMQLHAWINPFRAIATIEYADVIHTHISKRRPEWFFDYGLHRYFNPGIPGVRQYIISIIADIVRRYDVDGIHFDDYFYPYPERDDHGRIIPLPDYNTFRQYGQGFKDISQWRRHNITSFIQAVHDTIKSIKSWLIFGISPNAVWRNQSKDSRGSATRGLAAYDWLYADILLWDSLGLTDYIAPQLYFPIGHKYADYSVLLDWWAEHVKHSNLFIGLNLLGIDTSQGLKPWFAPEQLSRQIEMAMDKQQVKGIFLYRYKTLQHNPFFYNDTLRQRFFSSWTLFPRFAHADTTGPPAPVLDYYRLKDTLNIVWTMPEDSSYSADSIAFYSVYLFHVTDTSINRDSVLLTQQKKIKIVYRRRLLGRKNMYFVQVCAWDRWDNRGAPSKPLPLKLPVRGHSLVFYPMKF